MILNHEAEPGGISPRWEDVRAFAVEAEGAGVDALWIADHVVWDGDPWGRDDDGQYGSWEAWTTLAGLSSVTSRVTLGTLVSCTGYRNPALLAKMADSVDQMSGGRLVLGVGAGDAPDEFERFGYDVDRRVSRLADSSPVGQLDRQARVRHANIGRQCRSSQPRLNRSSHATSLRTRLDVPRRSSRSG